MMNLLIFKLWPALIPIAVYALWLMRCRRVAKKSGDPFPALLSGPWIITLVASVALLALSLFYMALSSEKNAGASYTPKRFENGTLYDESLE